MLINEEQLILLESYKDKTYVSAVLCEKATAFYSFYKNILNIPLILASSVMSLINSIEIDTNVLKYINIIVNVSTAFTLAIIYNFKFNERHINFKSSYSKFTKLLHQIEDSLINDRDNITTEDIREFINTYDSLYENIDYGFPKKVKEKVKNLYAGKRILPNILNCETFNIKIYEKVSPPNNDQFTNPIEDHNSPNLSSTDTNKIHHKMSLPRYIKSPIGNKLPKSYNNTPILTYYKNDVIKQKNKYSEAENIRIPNTLNINSEYYPNIMHSNYNNISTNVNRTESDHDNNINISLQSDDFEKIKINNIPENIVRKLSDHNIKNNKLDNSSNFSIPALIQEKSNISNTSSDGSVNSQIVIIKEK